MSPENQQHSFFQRASYSESSSTVNGATTSFKESTISDPTGTTYHRYHHEPGQLPVEERIELSPSGQVQRAESQARIEEVPADMTEEDELEQAGYMARKQ